MNLLPLKEESGVEKLQNIMVTGNENKGPTLPNVMPPFPVGDDAHLNDVPQSASDGPPCFSPIHVSEQDFGSLAKLMPSDFPDTMNNDSELIQRIGNELMRNLHDDSSRSSLSPLSSPGFHDGDLTSPEEVLPDPDTTTQMTLIEKSSELKLEETLNDSRTLWSSIMSEDACDVREREEGSRKAFKSSEKGDAPNSSVHLTAETGNLVSDGFDMSGVVSNGGGVDSPTFWNIIPEDDRQHEELTHKPIHTSESCTIPISSEDNLDFNVAGAVSKSPFIFQQFGKGIFSKNMLHLQTVVTSSISSSKMENAPTVVSESPEECVMNGEVSPVSPSLPSESVKCAVDSENESVVSSSTGPPAKKLREPSLNLQFPAKSGKMELKILVQPENQHRARYMTEGSRGAVKDESQQGHPKIQLLGYDEPINLQVFVGTDTGKVKPHGFYQACKVCGKNSTACSEKDIEGTVVIEIGLDPAEDMTANIDCVGILKLRNADVEQRIGLARSKKKSTRARLVFRVCIPKADGSYQTLQVASTAISCTQPAGQPEICKKSLSEAPVTGAEELFIIGKNFSKGTQVLFQEICDEKTVWTKEANIDQEYFQATHLICTVPAYVDTGVSKPVEVQIVVHSSGRVSEPQSFIYQPVAKEECSTKEKMKDETLVEEEVAMETDQGSRTSLFVSPAAVALNKMFEEASHGVSKSSPLLSSSLDQEQKMASLACMAPAPFTPQASKCLTAPTNTTNVNKPMVVTPTLEQLLSAPDQVSVASPPTPPTSALNMPPSLSVESNIRTLNSAPQDTTVLGNSRTEPAVVNAFSQCSSSVTGSLPSSTFINSLPSTKVNPPSAPLHITVPVTPDQLQNLLGHALLQSTVSNIGNAAVPQVLLVQPQSLPQGEPVQVRPQSQQQIFSPQIIQLQQCASQAPHIQPQQQTTQQANTQLQQIFQPQLQQSMHQLSFTVQQQSEQQAGQHDLPQVHQQTVRQVAQKVKPEEAQAQLIEPLEELRALQKQLKQENELAQQEDSPMPQQLQEEPLSVKQQKPCLSELPLQELQELQQQIQQQEQQRSQQLTSPGQQNLSPRCALEESQFKTEADSMIKIVQELQSYEKQHQEQNLQSIHQHLTQHEAIQQSVQQHQQQSQTTQHQQPMQQQQIVQSPQQQMIKETPQPQLVQQPQIVQQPQAFQQLQTTNDSPVIQQQEMVEEKPSAQQQQQQQIIHQPQVIPQQQIITQHQAVLQQQIVQQQVGQTQGIQQHTMVQQHVVGQQVVQQPIIQHTLEQPQLVQNQSPRISAQQPSNVYQSSPLLKVSGIENKQQNVQTITIISPQPSEDKPVVSEGIYSNCMSEDMTESMVSNLINMLTTPVATGSTSAVSTHAPVEAQGSGQQPLWGTSMASSAMAMDDNSLPNVPIDDVDRLLNTSSS